MKVSESESGWNMRDLFEKYKKILLEIAKESKKFSESGLESEVELGLMNFFEKIPNGDHSGFVYQWKKEREYI